MSGEAGLLLCGIREVRSLLTTVSDSKRRDEFCRLYTAAYPTGTGYGCPVDRPPPAMIVTSAGDIPLIGEWRS
jgi:hypothetical protein